MCDTALRDNNSYPSPPSLIQSVESYHPFVPAIHTIHWDLAAVKELDLYPLSASQLILAFGNPPVNLLPSLLGGYMMLLSLLDYLSCSNSQHVIGSYVT